MNQILGGIYLGSITAANDHKLLKQLNIKYVLSCGEFPDELPIGTHHMKLDIQDAEICKI